jgi:ketosteroid isomerase-like protein
MPALLLSVAACGGAGTSAGERASGSEQETAVLQSFDSLTAAIRALDVERMLHFYSTERSVVRVVDGRLIAGRDALERDFREGFTAVRSIDRLDVVGRHVAALGPEAVVLTVELDEAFTDTTGHVTAVHATWTSAWRRRASTWSIVHDAAIHAPARSSGKPSP